MDTSNQTLATALQQFIRWMRDEAIVLWGNNGFDPTSGAGYDFLLPSGKADQNGVRYLQNQAKLIYVYSRVECIGWGRSYQGIIKRVFEFVSRNGTSACRSDGYVHSLDSNLKILDSSYRLVDHGFFILASLATYTAFGHGGDVRRAHNILEWLDLWFKQNNGGWKESDAKSSTRQLASCLVMFECFIYLAEVTKKEKWKRRAETCFNEINQHLTASDQSEVYSQCDSQWQIANPQSVLEEQLQYVWLLNRFFKLTGQVEPKLVEGLFNNAEARFNSISANKMTITEAARALKAYLSMCTNGYAASDSLALSAIDFIANVAKKDVPAGFFTSSKKSKASSAADLYELMQLAVLSKNFVNNTLSTHR